MRRTRTGSTVLSATLAVLLTAAVAAGPAHASTVRSTAAGPAAAASQPSVPNPVPTDGTPDIGDGVVLTVAQVGGQAIIGGSFTTVTDHGGTDAIGRTNLLAYNRTTGKVWRTFAPSLDGEVVSLLPGPSASTVYVGGFFSTVNGATVRKITLLNTRNGTVVASFAAPPLNGAVMTMALVGQHLLIGGNFTTVGGMPRAGMASLDATTGALDSYTTPAFAGNHNYDGSGAKGSVGPKSFAVSPDGQYLMVAGNFLTADGQSRDQLARLVLGPDGASVDPDWATQQFTADCNSHSFDVTISAVAYAPDGSYFAVASSGGRGGMPALNTNDDGTRSMCDAAASFPSSATGTDVLPSWVDYSGTDSLWSVAVTAGAVYVGGHQRWMNNPLGNNNAGAGAVPRPGLAALDPISGLPLTWDPGRNPRGAGAYALLATPSTLYVGSDTDYIGNFQYKHGKIATFPTAGGSPTASTTTAALPGDVYLAGPLSTNTSDPDTDHLDYRTADGTTFGTVQNTPSTVAWSQTRGAFLVGDTLFYATSDGQFERASFDGSTVGSPTAIDPYHDPYWDGVDTGSKGITYDGVPPSFYGQLATLTGAFYTAGRLYYTLQGSGVLRWRAFTPDSGTVGQTEHDVKAGYLANAAGMTLSTTTAGSTLYYADTRDGTLHTERFANGRQVGSTDAVVSGPDVDGNDWRANGLFIRDDQS